MHRFRLQLSININSSLIRWLTSRRRMCHLLTMPSLLISLLLTMPIMRSYKLNNRCRLECNLDKKHTFSQCPTSPKYRSSTHSSSISSKMHNFRSMACHLVIWRWPKMPQYSLKATVTTVFNSRLWIESMVDPARIKLVLPSRSWLLKKSKPPRNACCKILLSLKHRQTRNKCAKKRKKLSWWNPSSGSISKCMILKTYKKHASSVLHNCSSTNHHSVSSMCHMIF